MAKRFTLVEAESLLPELQTLLQGAVSAKSEYNQAEHGIRELHERVMLMGGMLVDRKPALQLKYARESAAEKLRLTVEQIQEAGCVLKDLDRGLLDFPTLLRGEEVYLCWQLGESAIEFWHGLEEGFAGRKPIDQDFRDNHRGDRAQ